MLHAGIPRVTVAIMQNVVHQIGIYSRYRDGDCSHLYATEKGDRDRYSEKNSSFPEIMLQEIMFLMFCNAITKRK